MPEPTSFLWVAGDRGLDFVNTEVVAAGEVADLIDGPDALARWLTEAGAVGPAGAERLRTGLDGRAVEQARDLRAALRRAAVELAAARPVPAEVVDAVNAGLGHLRGTATVVPAAGGYARRFAPDVAAPLAAVGLLADAAAGFLCTVDPARVRKCQNPDCILYFVDTSKAGGRRWCSMALCGNRAKAAGHYARRKRPGSSRDEPE